MCWNQDEGFDSLQVKEAQICQLFQSQLAKRHNPAWKSAMKLPDDGWSRMQHFSVPSFTWLQTPPGGLAHFWHEEVGFVVELWLTEQSGLDSPGPPGLSPQLLLWKPSGEGELREGLLLPDLGESFPPSLLIWAESNDRKESVTKKKQERLKIRVEMFELTKHWHLINRHRVVRIRPVSARSHRWKCTIQPVSHKRDTKIQPTVQPRSASSTYTAWCLPVVQRRTWWPSGSSPEKDTADVIGQVKKLLQTCSCRMMESLTSCGGPERTHSGTPESLKVNIIPAEETTHRESNATISQYKRLQTLMEE